MNNLEEYKENIEDDNFEINIIKKIVLKTITVLIAILLTVSVIYISGIRQYFFFSETKLVEIEKLSPITDFQIVVLPARFLIISENSLETRREKNDINFLVNNTSAILNQASINIKIVEIINFKIEENKIKKILTGNLFELENFNDGLINVLLVKNLNGINGIAFPERNIIFLADYVAGDDYRVLAHEIGHLLGLRHKEERQFLMSPGASGNLLTEDEIKIMHQKINEKL